MNKYNSFYETVDQIVSYGINRGILHLYTSGDAFHGTSIRLQNKPVINFGSCSYLGLEFDERLKQGAKKAIDMFGTQFSESRAYVSLSLYSELQQLLEQIFEAPVVIAPTTTLAHIANIPIMVESNHAVIMDQQVHNSVQTAVEIIKARGVCVELLRHNRMDMLEERILALKDKHAKIWYMADGIYSMFGDHAPVNELIALMDKYPALHCYFDDAHGMSIYGKHGRGFILNETTIHPKMVIATSLNKAFACGGGLLVYGNKELAGKVSRAGGPLLSSGPMQPSALGAGIAAARIHLSVEITTMQESLRQNIAYAHTLLSEFELPLVSTSGAAILFVGVSLPRLGHNLVRRMLDAGFYVNLGIFPTVPMKQTGIRFTITRLHTKPQIKAMIETLAREFWLALEEENISLPEILKAFNRMIPTVIKPIIKTTAKHNGLVFKHYKTVTEISEQSWDTIFADKGIFNWQNLLLLEKVFTGYPDPENNWQFDYLVVSDFNNNVIAASFFTTTIWKDDMLSEAGVSIEIEKERTINPYSYTSKIIAAGSLLTEGEHCFINYEHSGWKEALHFIIEKVYALKAEYNADHVMLRDFVNIDPSLDDWMIDNGFFKIAMPCTHLLFLKGQDANSFYESLSKNSKKQLRKKVLKHEGAFFVNIISDRMTAHELEHMYNLYLQVKNRSMEINTFPIPINFFEAISEEPNWEILTLRLKEQEFPCCYVCSYYANGIYSPIVIGMDYSDNCNFNIYRQALYQLTMRALTQGADTMRLGFSASIEKRKMGALALNVHAYMHTEDHFNMAAMAQIGVLKSTGV